MILEWKNGRITVSDPVGVLWINAFRQIYLADMPSDLHLEGQTRIFLVSQPAFSC